VQWPVPLRAAHEFAECGHGIDWDESLPAKANYGRIADMVMALFVDSERQAAIRRESAIYFDQRVAPEQVPRYLIATEEQSVSAPQPTCHRLSLSP